ncbi:MFS transporter [Flindersiella endophytica]
MPRLLVPVIAVCCGVTVANIYLGQPLLTLIQAGLGVSAGAAGWVATFGQLGYALGVLLFLPLGDVVRRRPLLLALLAGTVGALGLASGATSLPVLLGAVLLASAFTVIPQLLIPLAAEIAPAQHRGRVIAAAQTGVVVGIIGSRAFGGVIGEQAGWRTSYVIAALATAAIGLVTVALLPMESKRTGASYARLLRSLPELLRTEPALRHASLLQAVVFGTFTMFWATLVFLFTGPPYHFHAGQAALLSLVGLVGAGTAPLAGRLADRFGPLPVAGAGAGLIWLAAVGFTLAQHALAISLLAIAVLNAGLQLAMVSNQTRVMSLRPDARSRLNTVFVVLAFVGGSAGAALGATLYEHLGWSGVGFTGLGAATLACLTWLVIRLRS